MIRINQNQLKRFKKTKTSYLYPVRRGVYLSFDINTLEYIGVEMFLHLGLIYQ